MRSVQGARLQGARLDKAMLQGADLTQAEFQGASLVDANLEFSELKYTFVFGADTTRANINSAVVCSVYTEAIRRGKDNSRVNALRLSAEDVHKWIVAATQLATQESAEEITNRFNRLMQLPPDAEAKSAQNTWRDRQTNEAEGCSLSRVSDFVCDRDGAPYIARALIRVTFTFDTARLAALGEQLPIVRARMEEGRNDPQKCPGVIGFTQADWHALEAIKPIPEAPK